jgi:heptosyltransferase-2
MNPGREPLKLVVRGVNWLGDAIMTTPALRRLREALPRTQITLLTSAKLADLWLHQPFLDDVLVFSPGQSPWKTAALLRERQFDAGLIFPNSFRSALEFRLAGIPRRVGYARAWRTWLLTDPVPARAQAVPMRKRSRDEILRMTSTPVDQAIPTAKVTSILAQAHQAHEYLTLAAAFGASTTILPPTIHVTPEEIAAARDRLGIDPKDEARPWFGLNPGAEYGPAKRWPETSFVEAAVHISSKTGCRWVIFGGPGDIPAARRIEDEIQTRSGSSKPVTLNLAGKTTLRQLAAALQLCRVVITNDTGPMHLASAVGTPVVVPFGSTSPELTGPVFATNARILKTGAACAPCFLKECPIDSRCLREITPDRVARAVLELLGSSNSHPGA